MQVYVSNTDKCKSGCKILNIVYTECATHAFSVCDTAKGEARLTNRSTHQEVCWADFSAVCGALLRVPMAPRTAVAALEKYGN